jgi:hypothetical protein
VEKKIDVIIEEVRETREETRKLNEKCDEFFKNSLTDSLDNLDEVFIDVRF